MKVIDISEHQGKIDFKKVRSEIDGIIIRAGYGKGNIDRYFKKNIEGAIKNGFKIGIYWFSYAYSVDMAKREARFCNDLLEPYKDNITLPVFFDWEYDSMKFAKKNGVNPGKALITTMTKAFCEEVTELGYDAGYYLNLDYSKNYYDESQLPYKRWFARYIKTEQRNCYLWQYSSEGKVSGISGNVDMNVLWGAETEEKPQPSNSPVEEKKPSEKPHTASQRYSVGSVYTVSVRSALNVRRLPSTKAARVPYSELTADGKKHATSSGALKNGTKVTCLDVKIIDPKNVWIKIPSGWVCAIDGDKKYIV